MEMHVELFLCHPRLRLRHTTGGERLRFGARSGMTVFICFLALQSQAAPIPSAPVVSISTFSVEAVPSTFTWRSVPNTAFGGGEDFHYVVKWGGVLACYSSLSVPEILDVDHLPTYHIVTAARSGAMG